MFFSIISDISSFFSHFPALSWIFLQQFSILNVFQLYLGYFSALSRMFSCFIWDIFPAVCRTFFSFTYFSVISKVYLGYCFPGLSGMFYSIILEVFLLYLGFFQH